MNIFIKILQCLAIFLTSDLLQAQLVSNVDRVKERYQQRVAKADQIKNDAISQSTLRYDSEVKMAQDEVKQSFESLIRAAAMRNQIDEVRTLTLQMESILRPDGVVLSGQGSTGSAYSQQASSSVPKVNDNSKVITSAAPSRKGFAGDWDTSFGKMKLEVSGDSVRGTYQMGADLCQVEGKISGQEMLFNYKEPSAKGKGRFTLASDGLSFSGKWLQDGSNQWQQWEGRRPSEAASKQSNLPSKRAWGPEQATGAPDTATAGDFQTAWASLLPDGGPEWLQVEFPKPVVLGEVRIRETFNPGAISKITAFLNNQEEVLLWEGEANALPAPSDMVVKPDSRVLSNRVKIYLDTTRVQGWNEIDAVELVGEDGSRQWASSATASSTYAEKAATPAPQISNTSQQNASASPLSNGFAGDWDTSFGKMKLEVSGDSVRGTYQMGSELCQIEGKISGQEMVFNYTELSAKGEGKFTLAPDGRSFSGQWLQDGSNQWKPWQGRRPSEAAGKQWNNLEELVGSELFDVNGNKVDVRSLQGKIIGLYFSAHWCRPCRDFTPKLVEFRNANAKDFEVIFVSSDRSATDQQKYMQESGMNWPAVPYQSECKAILKERFSIRGIPALIIVDGKGNLISAQGRSEVNANSTTTLAKWKNLSPNR
jgi:nucleoredoxin